jgi:hypothetical protein
MAPVVPSYLTCTAAQAEEFNQAHPHRIISLNQLLAVRATSHPNVCIAGFPEYDASEEQWNLMQFSMYLLHSNVSSQ